MPRLRLGANNIYIRIGLGLLGLAVLCFVYMFGPWAAPGIRGFWLTWLTMASFFGGLALYFIGRVAHALRSRARD